MSTLQQDYLKTLQANVGQSQRQLKENLIKTQATGETTQQRTLSNVPNSYEWADRGVSGFRGAGFKEMSGTVDPGFGSFFDDSVKSYTENNKNISGYYGDYDPSKFVLSQGPSLEQAFRDLYNQTQANKYTTFGYGGSEGKWVATLPEFGGDQTYRKWEPPIPAQTGYRYQGFDYENLDALKAAQKSEIDYLLSDPNITRNAYLQLKNGGDLGWNQGLVGHTKRYDQGSGNNIMGSEYFEYRNPGFVDVNRMGLNPYQPTGNGLKDLINITKESMFGGKPQDILKNRFGNIWNGTVSDPSLMKTLFGGSDILYDGKDMGDFYKNPGNTLTQNEWNDSWKKTKKNLLVKKVSGENKGGANYLRSIYDLGLETASGDYFAPNDYETMAKFAGDDKRYNSSYSKSSLTGVGKVLGTALSIFGGPFGAVGAAALNGMNISKGSNAYTGESYRNGPNGLGMVAGFLGSQIPGLSETIGNQFGLTGQAANTLGNALIQGGVGTASGLGSGMSLGDALKQGAVGAVSGGLQPYLGNLASVLGDNELGKVVATTVMKTGTKGLNNLLTGNKFGKDMGTVAVSSALSGLGNLYDRSNKDATTYQQMQKPQQQTRKV